MTEGPAGPSQPGGAGSSGGDRPVHVRDGALRHGRAARFDLCGGGRKTVDAITAVLNRYGAQDIVYFGDWQTEDLSTQR